VGQNWREKRVNFQWETSFKRIYSFLIVFNSIYIDIISWEAWSESHAKVADLFQMSWQ
jgi:hypothetical protein